MEVYLLLIGLTVMGLFLILRKRMDQQRKKEFGREGELIVHRKLRLWLSWGGGKVYEDMTLITKSGDSTQIDHLAINRRGVFCIETKHLNGTLKGDIDKHEWVHTNLQGKRNIIYNPIFQNKAHIRHLANILKLDQSDILGFVTNVGDAKLKGNINPLFGKPAIESGTWFIFKLWLLPKNKFSKEQVDSLVALVNKKLNESSERGGDEHNDYVRRLKGEGESTFILNYLYFVIFVLAIYAIYKIFFYH